MFSINKITSDHVVDFAAEELKKYLRMMMCECGEITISYSPDSTKGFRLGLMSDFGLDTSEADDITLDDIVHIDTDEEGGIIAGSNPRSVLLAVYRYLRENGCRWLFPGVDGEFIPMRDIVPVKYHKMADCRFRGQCNEGAEYQQNMMETIDFTPKIGMNIFMIEFDNPRAYYDSYYNHAYNEKNRIPEPVSPETVLQWKRQCEAEISKRGLQFHDMGHGWTAESFGIDSSAGWVSNEENPIPEGSREYLAELDGVRKLYGGVALNTNFCMSNPDARALVVKRVCDHAALARNVDYLHVWLADANNNHCECKKCAAKTTSDWYIILMNEIDAELTARSLSTRIVFCCYYDTTYPAEQERLNNPDRFTVMLAAITRKYTESVSSSPVPATLSKYKRNANKFPATIGEYCEYARIWQAEQKVRVLVYEYHFWVNQYYDPCDINIAKILYDDVRGYKAKGFDGIVQDGSQRSYFPNGFAFYVYGETLFDNSVSFDYLTEDYFSHAYGEDWKEAFEFLKKTGDILSHEYLTGERSASKEVGALYNPAVAQDMRKMSELTDEFAKFIEAHKNMPYRAQTVAYRLLEKYTEFCDGLSRALALKALGAGKEASEEFSRFMNDFGKYETEIERYFDHCLCAMALSHRVFRRRENSVPGI